MSRYFRTFKVKEDIKIKKINRFFFPRWCKLLEKYKAIWNKIEDLKNIELNALLVYFDRDISTK